MDDHRRRADGFAPTVAIAPSGSVPVARALADTQLAAGTEQQPPPADKRAEPEVGGAIGAYTVTARIGSDPIGVVFAAQDGANRVVAIKLVHATVAHVAYRTRLVRTAPALAALAHPSLVQIEEIGVAFGRPFVVMEMARGPLLSAWLDTRRPWDEIAAVFAEIGAALAAAHRAGFGHGDWSLDCVIVEADHRPRLIDVGLGRFDPSRSGKLDARVDQLRFAVALRGALGGSSGGDRALWDSVPASVRAVVTRAVDDASPTRFVSMSEVVDALDAARGRRSARTLARPPRRPMRRVAIAVLGALILVAAAIAGFELMPKHDAPPPAPVTATPIP